MKKYSGHLLVLSLAFLLACLHPSFAQNILLSPQQINWIGQRIFQNECGSKDQLLLQWNEGEDFLSLGIGHFIWYHQGGKGPFEEDFPKFLAFAKASGAPVPAWLRADHLFCPWGSRDDFLRSQQDPRLLELRKFLVETKPLQVDFIVKNFNDSLPSLLQHVPLPQRKTIQRNLDRLLPLPSGVFALIDYGNFKGMGTLPAEGYRGKGWGLMQVLSEMRDEKEAPDALAEFVQTAKRVLARRVANSPKERNEQKWLPGWQNRVDAYLT